MFGLGQGVEVSATFVANTFLLFYLTSVAGLDPTTAGSIIFLSLIVDAVADPLIGSWSDRSRSRWGRRLPFMVVGLPIVCAASVALFGIPLSGKTAAAAGVALLLNVMLRVGTSLYALPYAALTAELTDDYDERSSVTIYRMVFGFVGTVLTIAPAFGLIFVTKEAYASRGAYVQLGLLLSIVVLVMGLACVLGVHRAVAASPVEHLPPTATNKAFVSDLGDLIRNRSFLALFTSALIVLIIGGSMTSLNLYAYNYFWKVPATLNQFPILGFQLGLLLGIPLTALLLRWLEKRDVVILGLCVIAFGQTSSVFVAHLWLGPLPNPQSMALLVAASSLFGACNSLFFIAFQSMIADAVDEHELKFGQRCDALYYSALIFSAKAATGIGSLIAGLILTAVGLKSSAGAAATAISEPSATSLGLLWGAGHGIAFLCVSPLLLLYRLDRRRHRQLIDEISRQRTEGVT
jgi:GPH family glycoside/pentoside/hexuronide:cation symporter